MKDDPKNYTLIFNCYNLVNLMECEAQNSEVDVQ